MRRRKRKSRLPRTSRPRTRHLRTKRNPTCGRVPAAEQPEPAGGSQAPEAPASDGADAEPAGPPRRTSVVERIVAPAVAEREAVARSGQEHVDAMNAVPVADGGPGAIVAAGTGAGASRDAEPPAVPGNGHDTASDALEIPAFLRRS